MKKLDLPGNPDLGYTVKFLSLWALNQSFKHHRLFWREMPHPC